MKTPRPRRRRSFVLCGVDAWLTEFGMTVLVVPLQRADEGVGVVRARTHCMGAARAAGSLLFSTAITRRGSDD